MNTTSVSHKFVLRCARGLRRGTASITLDVATNTAELLVSMNRTRDVSLRLHHPSYKPYGGVSSYRMTPNVPLTTLPFYEAMMPQFVVVECENKNKLRCVYTSLSETIKRT